jgi:hypothetical protein
LIDIRRLLRFEISGYVGLLYSLLFIACLFEVPSIDIGIYQIVAAAAAGLVIALPIGFVIHQLDITIFCPFRASRIFGKRRAFLRLKHWKDELGAVVSDSKLQSIIVHAKTTPQAKCYDHYKYIQNEIDKRYSYYYSRWETGSFSPFLGMIISFIIWAIYYATTGESLIDISGRYFVTRLLAFGFIIIGIIIISLIIILYCRDLFREIDDLELSVVVDNEDYVKKVLSNLVP